MVRERGQRHPGRPLAQRRDHGLELEVDRRRAHEAQRRQARVPLGERRVERAQLAEIPDAPLGAVDVVADLDFLDDRADLAQHLADEAAP